MNVCLQVLRAETCPGIFNSFVFQSAIKVHFELVSSFLLVVGSTLKILLAFFLKSF